MLTLTSGAGGGFPQSVVGSLAFRNIFATSAAFSTTLELDFSPALTTVGYYELAACYGSAFSASSGGWLLQHSAAEAGDLRFIIWNASGAAGRIYDWKSTGIVANGGPYRVGLRMTSSVDLPDLFLDGVLKTRTNVSHSGVTIAPDNTARVRVGAAFRGKLGNLSVYYTNTAASAGLLSDAALMRSGRNRANDYALKECIARYHFHGTPGVVSTGGVFKSIHSNASAEGGTDLTLVGGDTTATFAEPLVARRLRAGYMQ